MVLTSLSLLLFAAGALGAIIPARNAHTAPIDDIPAGGVGRVDTDNPSVRVHIKAGMLVPVDGTEAFDAAPPPSRRLDALRPTDEQIRAMLDEMEHRGDLLRERDNRIFDLTAERNQLAAKVADLEAGASKGTKDLRAELAAARAELASLKGGG